MFMLARHRRRWPRDDRGDTADLVVALDRCVEYLLEFWREPCFDWWEENVDGVHVSTLVSIEAGLRAVSGTGLLAPSLATRAEDTAATIVALVERVGTADGHLVKTIGAGARVDASLISAFVPFGTFDPHSGLATRTYERILTDLAPDGVHRYLGDTYFGGGRWVVLAGFLGSFEARTGRTDAARRRLAWMAEQQTADGLLPEQSTAHPLDPDYVDHWVQRWGPVATPLLWSHAMYITLADDLAGGS
jgi:GH15 family glucan-1,4-alpha-glucosidase